MPLRFDKILIADERYESAGVFDVDNDGHLDIVSGAYWYPGPDFRQKCPIGEVLAVNEYFDDFSTIPVDVDGDGYLDVVTGGWWGETLRWRRNPRGDREAVWDEHVIAHCGNIETTRGWDVDGDGELEFVPNTPNHPQRIYKRRPDGTFAEQTIFTGPSGHGLGCGDIDGDGRRDLVISSGWIEGDSWTFHAEFELGLASIPIIVADVNGDGLSDLIVGQAHGYGLDWWEQQVLGGRRRWVQHPIDPHNSQYHDLHWVDIDGDGQPELVTGKRYRAHNDRDPGALDDVGLYYFKWDGGSFSKQVIDYGPPRVATGAGISFQVIDVDGSGDGLLDVVAPGKDGLYLFRNLGPS
jgi:hypothetical protein